MTGPLKQKYFASDAAIITPTYRGPDRREPTLQGRRKDDEAIDLLKRMDARIRRLNRFED